MFITVLQNGFQTGGSGNNENTTGVDEIEFGIGVAISNGYTVDIVYFYNLR